MSDPLKDLEQLVEARRKATAGPWRLGSDGSIECDAPGEPAEIVTRGYDDNDEATGVLLTKDAIFVALCGQPIEQWEAILAEMRRLREIVDGLPKWIACSDRMPEQEVEVLVVNDRSDIRPDLAWWEDGFWRNWNWHQDLEPDAITHWTPIPTFPAEAAKEASK